MADDQPTLTLAGPLALAPDGSFATVEQDSDDDIRQCIRALLQTRVGDRADLPDMGVAPLEFEEQPLDLDGLREVLGRHEPRIAALLATEPDAIDQAIADVTVGWARQPTVLSDDTEA